MGGGTVDNEYDPSEFLPLASIIAEKYSHRYPDIEQEDICQELSLALVEKAKYFSVQPRESRQNYIRKALYRVAQTYCGKEWAEYSYGHGSAYFYRPEDVRRMLQEYVQPKTSVREGCNWELAEQPDDAEDGNPVDLLCDIGRALPKLGYTQKRAVLAAHLTPSLTHGRPDWQATGRAVGKSASAVRADYGRAIEALTRILNGQLNAAARDHQGPAKKGLTTR